MKSNVKFYESGKFYDVVDFHSRRRKQMEEADFKGPPRANFLIAANHIRKVLDGQGVNWAAMGGLGMLCLGYRRNMRDIHVVYDERDRRAIYDKLEADRRVRFPKGMNLHFPTRILLRTGGFFNDVGCTENVEVEVNLIPPGFYGTPPTDALRRNQVLLRLNLDGKINNFKTLNVLYLVKTTLALCESRALAWDPKKDIVFLCQSYGKELSAIRPQLNQEELQSFFFTPYFANLPVEEQRRCSLALQGNEFVQIPPMLTTAGHQNSRPSLQSQRSAPHLNSGLPIHNTNNITHTRNHATTGYPANYDSRSGYRVTSAPNTPDPNARASRGAQPQAHHPRSRSAHSPDPFHRGTNQPTIQHARNVSMPQIVHSKTPPPMAAVPMDTASRRTLSDPISGVSGLGATAAYGFVTPEHSPTPQEIAAAMAGIPFSSQYQLQGGQNCHELPPVAHIIPPTPQSNIPLLPQSEHYAPLPMLQRSKFHHVQRTRSPEPMRPSSATGLRIVGPEGLYSSQKNTLPRLDTSSIHKNRVSAAAVSQQQPGAHPITLQIQPPNRPMRSHSEPATPSPHITEELQSYYQTPEGAEQEKTHQVNIQPSPKKSITGYEGFAHGPYSAVETPWASSAVKTPWSAYMGHADHDVFGDMRQGRLSDRFVSTRDSAVPEPLFGYQKN